MSDTPETDAIADFYLAKAFSKNPEDRTGPCQFAARLERERDEAREVNAKLRDIAERAINYLDQSYRDGFSDEVSDLRYELEQLKEEAK